MNRIMQILLMSGAAAVLMVSGAHAAKVWNVSNTVHNMASQNYANNAYASTNNERRVCIFCHTPHSGRSAPGQPLWNRTNPSTTYQLYNSTTLSFYARPSQVGSVSSESLACLSCHDGSIAVNRIINESFVGDPRNGNDVFVSVLPGGFFGEGDEPQSRIGADRKDDGFPGVQFEYDKLGDDHPISFSYNAVDGQDNKNELHTPLSVEAAGLKLYGSNKRVECGTCHDPHVEYENTTLSGSYDGDPNYAPFLRIPNTGSAMCLTCHNK